MRHEGGWYEEDSAWAIVVTIFSYWFSDAEREKAHETFRHWYPDEYERFYEVELAPGDSIQRDKATFYAENAQNWITIAAWGEWASFVPKGKVGVCATLGGRTGDGLRKRYFLVDSDRYANRNPLTGLVIDEEIDQRIRGAAMKDQQNEAKWGIWCIRRSRSVFGSAAAWAEREGIRIETTKEEAEKLAAEWNGKAESGNSAIALTRSARVEAVN